MGSYSKICQKKINMITYPSLRLGFFKKSNCYKRNLFYQDALRSVNQRKIYENRIRMFDTGGRGNKFQDLYFKKCQ